MIYVSLCLEKSLSKVFGRIKLHKRYVEIYFFLLLKKVSFNTALVIDTITNAVLQILSLNRDNFLK